MIEFIETIAQCVWDVRGPLIAGVILLIGAATVVAGVQMVQEPSE